MEKPEIRQYLHRINYQGSLQPTLETLRALHEAHLLAVPFENLNIHLGRPIKLDQHALFTKIVLERRGGFCYELNGLFAALLQALGFSVTLLSAGVAREDGSFGPEFDHLTLLVHLDEDWLADVGFGASFRQPLRFVDGQEQEEALGRYRLQQEGVYWIYSAWHEGWKPQYHFTLRPHQLADYAQMCQYHQSSPESHFTQHRICSLANHDGRKTLSDLRFIATVGATRTERLLKDEEEYRAVLSTQFGVDI